jgi:GT2 family glycosyltransferase
MTLACLASLGREPEPPTREVIVVDNASADGSEEAVRESVPSATVIQSGHNLGFARAVNRGAASASGRYLLMLNPDAVLTPGTIAALVARADAHPDEGLWGGRVLFPDGRVNPTTARPRPTLWSLAGHAFLFSSAFRRNAVLNPVETPGWDRSTLRHVDMLTGALLMVSEAAWRRLGGFDDRFFLYGDDADLCHRAVDLGYRPTFVPGAEITHAPGSASPETAGKIVLMRAGEVTYLRRHYDGWRLRAYLALLEAGVLSRRVLGRFSTSSVDWGEVWRARRRWLAGFPEAAPAGWPPEDG